METWSTRQLFDNVLAHREAWETYTDGNKHQILAMARVERSEANEKEKGKKKKKKGTLKTI